MAMDGSVTEEVEAARAMRAGVAGKRKPPKSLRMGPVDYEVLATLAVARYLTHRQLVALGFWKAEFSAYQRMATFAGLSARSVGDLVVVEKHEVRTGKAERTVVWGLTELGYRIAADLVSIQPKQSVGPELLQHEVELNELLVALLRGGLHQQVQNRQDAREALGLPLKGTPFRWLSAGGATQLPWQEYDRAEGRAKERLIKPDGILELPAQRQRVFLELERGTHTIVPVDPRTKDGATVNKVERYRRFCTNVADAATRATFYGQTYADGFAPRLVFLVHSVARRDHVRAAIQGLPRLAGSTLPVEVYTRDEAARLLLDQVYGTGTAARVLPKADAAAPAPSPWQVQDMEELAQFAFEAYGTIQQERHRIREENRRQATALPEPRYPANTAKVIDLLRKLGIWKDR